MQIITEQETNTSNRDVEVVVSKDQIDTFQKDGVILIKKALNSKQVHLGREAIAESILNPGPHAEFLGEKDARYQQKI